MVYLYVVNKIVYLDNLTQYKKKLERGDFSFLRITTFFELGEQFLFTDIFEMHIY